jgi:hypothetical protein
MTYTEKEKENTINLIVDYMENINKIDRTIAKKMILSSSLMDKFDLVPECVAHCDLDDLAEMVIDDY